MKKLNILTKSIFLFAIVVSLFSCSEEENELQNAANGEKGAFARIVTSSENKNTNLNDIAGSTWSANIEFVDAENGALVDSYSLYATFRDNTIDSETAPNYSISDEVLIDTWNKSVFDTSGTYPSLNFTVSSSDLISKLGLDVSNADGGDTFVLRGEITLSDGRMFTTTNSGVSITSESFYNDAFSFTSQFVCVPSTPPTGDYRVVMNDSYGDGWQGDGIKVTIDGVEQQATLADGSNGETIIVVPAGAQTMEWVFTGDSYPSEVSFKIYGPNSGEVIANVSNPSAGSITLNLCKE